MAHWTDVNIPNLLAALQVALGLLAMFAQYHLSTFLYHRLRGYDIFCVPLEGVGSTSRKWQVSIVFKRGVGDVPSLICSHSRARNHIEDWREFRIIPVARRVNLNDLGYLEVETKHALKGKIISFDIEFFYSDEPRISKRGVSSRAIRYYRAESPVISPDEAAHYKQMVVAKWRALWVATGFSELALVALVRMIYLGWQS